MNKKSINEWMALCLATTLILTIANIHQPLHYVFGSIFFGLVAVHLNLHKKWISALFRSNGVIQIVHRKTNIWLFSILTICAFCGFAALLGKSGLPGWSRHQTFHYSALHAISGFLSIITMIVHLVMHRKWLAAVGKRNLGSTNRPDRAGVDG
jgi:hypothetical protein